VSLMPMSRLPRSFWLGSTTSPPVMTSSYFSDGSPGVNPRGVGAPSCAICIGAAAADDAPLIAVAAAAAVVEARERRRGQSVMRRLWGVGHRLSRRTFHPTPSCHAGRPRVAVTAWQPIEECAGSGVRAGGMLVALLVSVRYASPKERVS